MMQLGALRVLALSGGEWVIWLLLAASVVTVAVIVERWLLQRREARALDALRASLPALLEKDDFAAAAKAAAGAGGAAGNILAAALSHARAGAASVEEYAAAARIVEKRRLERRLLVLGSLGNNAPFIGLFGTVLGVIRAFHDLAGSASAGPEVVMMGLSEALIATAVGLLVAIPAVMAYNYFQKKASDALGEAESLLRTFLARLRDGSR